MIPSGSASEESWKQGPGKTERPGYLHVQEEDPKRQRALPQAAEQRKDRAVALAASLASSCGPLLKCPLYLWVLGVGPREGGRAVHWEPPPPPQRPPSQGVVVLTVTKATRGARFATSSLHGPSWCLDCIPGSAPAAGGCGREHAAKALPRPPCLVGETDSAEIHGGLGNDPQRNGRGGHAI